ncbi:MAG TPA: ABC transporter substrate-binding protein [Candidatus Binatia bacterium]|jgi:ABC-type nitrate/sulfonate/bicarbonate transport system substrate-binding protein
MTETLKLIQFRAAYNLPVHAGIETGIFARHGLALETAYTPGSLYISQALKEGQYDIGHTGADDIIAAVENDDRSDLFIFMGLHSGLFTLVGAPGCASIDGLFGRSIGVDARTSGFALVLERMLHARGFARGDYQLIEIGGWESRYRALMGGKIAATLLTEPFVLNALAAGCHLLARDFEMIPSYQGTCGAASRRWAEQHPDRLVRYIRAYAEATQWCFERANRRACLNILARYNEIDGAAAEHTLDALLHPKHGLYANAVLNMSGLTAALELRAELGYLAHPIPPVEKYVDLSYHRTALPTPG